MSPTVPELNCASPGFHVKHVDTELSVIAEVRGHQRTLDELRRNGCGYMTRQNVGCRDNRAAGWGVARNHRELRTRPDQCFPPLAEWVDLGRGRNRPLPSALRLCAGVWGQVREGAAGPQVGTQYPATMNPRGRSSPRLGACSVDRYGSVVKVKRERRWSTTSVSRETTGRFGFGVWKRGCCQLLECRYFARRLRWLGPR